ncbi:MAG: Ferrous-iron efflux pump FieF [Phycisphaerae bacterium]|nr:Ferrous-iron efflux pump FieF [Phycisphaerae bacterium]
MSDLASRRRLTIPVIGLLVNAVLALVKLVAGLVGHSGALVADAVESFADISASLVVWQGVQVASRPADENHPYGHGKAEAVAALIVALMLFGAAVGIAIEAVREIATPHHAPAAFTLWVLLAVVLVKEGLYRLALSTARRTGSTAVLSDAWHHRSDAITSAAAAVGITVALVGGSGFEPADDWAALFAAAVIVYNASRLLMPPLHELMDAAPPQIIAQARAAAGSVRGVERVEKVFARKSGVGYWVDMHVEVAPTMTVLAAHDIAHAVKDHLRATMPEVLDVLVHVEPHKPRQ